LFYQTSKGAEVVDLFMSLIHTAELSSANPFDYLTQLQRHTDELAEELYFRQVSNELVRHRRLQGRLDNCNSISTSRRLNGIVFVGDGS
jgi:hypothetical protein